ncbi:hypothetical protein MAM1_0058d03693 [Mucor ambiguus]|uniref:Uncharacterized protein n=1 Tax=Mucor ambiguus TaxID=91626 RepID=A0A0C9MQF8_9FUNG|nr:hypothetical protein MAM1_0058d03693 [Mucor ambiguus]
MVSLKSFRLLQLADLTALDADKTAVETAAQCFGACQTKITVIAKSDIHSQLDQKVIYNKLNKISVVEQVQEEKKQKRG